MQPGERFLHPSRRELLAGLTTAALAPGTALAAPSPGLSALFDRAAAEADPARRLALLRAFDPKRLDLPDAAIWRMVLRGVEREQALRRAFPYGKADGSSPYVVSQRHGAWLELAEPKPGLAARLDAETARLEAEPAPPGFIVEAVLEGLDAAPAPPGLDGAVARQRAALRALRPVPGTGVWRVAGGATYYQARLRCTTGSDLTPEALDRLVAAETKALLGRADRLLRGLGLRRGSVGARLRALRERTRYDGDEAGRTRAVGDMNSALDRLRPHLPRWFDPPFEPRSSVRRMSPADERAGRRGYREPPFYYPDLGAVADRPGWTLATVAFHETVPGHLLQLRRQALAEPHPLQVRYAAGYSEGWAIYAESLADRIGVLTPVEQLGFIQSLLFRLARVTADSGLHLRRWSRKRAIRCLEETVGFELFFPFAVEVDRYAAEPASFAGDALVAIELRRRGLRLRPAAARRFHAAVLNRGPLSVEALAALR